jgi:hypothetical protein
MSPKVAMVNFTSTGQSSSAGDDQQRVIEAPELFLAAATWRACALAVQMGISC